MIVVAGLLVLAGLGLFVAGVLTGVTALYWACVGACAVAAVLLIASRRQTAAQPPAAPDAREADEPPARAGRRRAPETAESPVTTRFVDTDDDDRTPEPAAVTPEAPEPAEEPDTAAEAPSGIHATAHRTAAPGATAVGASAAGTSGPKTGAHAAVRATTPSELEEPGIEEVEVTDLLLVVDLTDEVLVVDEHPRYHLEGCRFLAGRETIPIPLDEARTDGFTPCALCTPDRHLADRERARKAARNS